MDFRKQWFEKCILSSFGETDPELINSFFSRNDSEMGRKFDSYLNDETELIADLWNQVFVVYKTYYSKMIEEEVEVQEEATKQRSSSLFGQDDKKKDKKGRKKKKGKKATKVDEDDDEELDDVNPDDFDIDDDDDDDDRKGKRSKKTGKTGGRSSPSTMMENVSQDEGGKKSRTAVSYVTVKKKIQKVVQLPQFQGYFGAIESEKMDPNVMYVYFIKKFNKPIPKIQSMAEAVEKMATHVVVGSMTGDVLTSVERLLSMIIVPLFRMKIGADDPGDIQKDVKFDGVKLNCDPSSHYLRKHTGINEPLRPAVSNAESSVSHHLEQFVFPNEERTWKGLLDQLIDLIDVVKWAQNELQRERQFVASDSLKEFDWNNGTADENVILGAKNSVENWITKLDLEFLECSDKEVSNLCLMDEYEYWKAKEIKLSSVVDELKSLEVKRVVDVLEFKYPSVFELFEMKKYSVINNFENAKENMELLESLQYFFKILTYSDFKTIVNIIPTLIESLKSIWVLSSYYGQEKNLERILINIKNTLCLRVKQAFDVVSVFRQRSPDVSEKLTIAINMLHTWKSSYLHVRSNIESVRDYSIRRWEFEKQKLFAESDYMSTVIKDLRNIFEIIFQFENLLNSKFKTSVQSAEYENLQTKVTNLTLPIEKVDFDIYLEIFRDEWQEVLDIFGEDVTEVDQRLKLLIIQSFSKSKSLSEVIEVVENISKMETRSTVHDSLPFICNKLITRFEGELKLTDQIFEKNKSRGNSYRIHASVVWARDLVQNLRSTSVKFEKISNLCSAAAFEAIMTQIENFELKVNKYIEIIFKDWSKTTAILIRETLKQNILEIEETDRLLDSDKLVKAGPTMKFQAVQPSKKTNTNHTTSTNRCELSFGALALTLKWIGRTRIDIESHLRARKIETLKTIEQAHKISWLEFVGNRLLIEKGFRFKVKLRDELYDAIEDAEKLQLNDFKLSDEILEFLAIKVELFEKIEKIKNIIANYNSINAKLELTEILFMKKYFMETEMSIQPGLTLYTWRCTILDIFCSRARKNLQTLLCLQYQMKKIFEKLDTLVSALENINFLPIRKIKPDGLASQEFFRTVAELQIEETENCLETYEMMSLALIQCESLILHTNSGKSSLMTPFYSSYCEKIFLAVKKSLMKSLGDMQMLFRGELHVYFLLTSYLENNDVKLQPTCDELFEIVKFSLIEMFTKLKFLKEWEEGSCITKRYSADVFYHRLINDEEIKEKTTEIVDCLHKLCNSLTDSMKHWCKYAHLWEHDKNAKIAEFASQKPELSDYEIQFDFYSNLINKIEQENIILSVFCARIDVTQLMGQLKNHCVEWKNKFGSQLTAYTKQMTNDVTKTIQRLNSSINVEISDEEALTHVVMSINETEKITTDIFIKFYKIEEQYHELYMQNLMMNENDAIIFKEVKLQWEKLYDRCLYKKFTLENVKISVKGRMKQKISKFLIKCDEFVTNYKKIQKKLFSSDYDTRVELIMEFFEKCCSLCEEKLDVDKVHECFEILDFELNEFFRIKSELEKLKDDFKLL